jgi:transcription initiation factor TFIIIB Brf1 subunit/transcription initiation factor TFIIB
MATTNAPKAAKSSRKDARNTIEEKLNLLLADLKKELGEGKFKNRVKKAAKLLSKGLDKTKKKAVTVKKKAAKKAKVSTKKPAVAATPAPEK